MKKAKIFIFYYLPAIVWMTIIFYMSSLPHFAIAGNTLFDFVIFKTLHMIEYGLLYFLLFRAFTKIKVSRSKKTFYPLIISFIYAILDEFHQTFVPTREGKLRDIIIDVAGIWIVFIYVKNKLK